MIFRRIDPGVFQMGSPEDEKGQGSAGRVAHGANFQIVLHGNLGSDSEAMGNNHG